MSLDVGLTLDVTQVAMDLERTRAQMAAHNIAMANVPGSRAAHLDVLGAMASVRSARGDAGSFAQALGDLNGVDLAAHQRMQPLDTPLALDAEVAELSAASGRFQALADGVSRQFALMQLAIKGGR